MKAFLRSRPVHAVLAALTWAYLWLVLRTVRWTHEGLAIVEEELKLGRGAIGCIWHGTIPLVVAAKPVLGARQAKILISLSPDGEFITRAAARLGIPAIRGSKAKTGAKSKGGAAAFRECLDWLAGGGLLLLTPDGPRGPREVMAMGVARMAKLSQAPVYLIGLAARPAAELNSWDRTRLPYPFGRGAVVWQGPFDLRADASDEHLAQACQDWGSALTAACARAQAALA